ncbi:MAG: fasciclin domain-containing protein [Methanothrix sp.]|nr:fasciclin domain-containing protein [Methanothrix sp.]
MVQKKWVLLSLLTASLICMSSCAAQNNTTVKYGVQDAANDLGLNEFSALMESANLPNTLNNQGVLIFGTGSFVIFAPSDEAIAGVKDIDMNSVKENQTELKSIISHHVVWNGDAFENISELSSVKTLQGENLTINNTDGLKVNGANVTSSKRYDNGTVFVIDKVLLPQKSSTQGEADA